ncbi:hypothetical protein LOK46_10375 [Methylobacterium sp. NMS14P]|uniref:hypothetical protein n=1 Tax=Methylobacterium sp. NMS14P TaxID=2894310 RepID=UPI002359B174|nr:hypothetical protein [Methylobacterium sp. NMS14P]WCS27194.1 hypothetical protein LOK46_10375 [Methylobacterium sp. NMS14P]
MARATPWILAHADLADEMFSMPMRGRLEAIRDRLAAHGYDLKLDIGKRTTKATVTSKTLRSKSTYPSVTDFVAFEERRLAAMDERAA